MILNQTRIETPKQTFVSNNTNTTSVPFISYIRKEKSKNEVILISDEEDYAEEEPLQAQSQLKSLDQQEQQTVNLTSSSRPNKQRKIEGSQSDPISLDDSDDDMAEIVENPMPITEKKLPPSNEQVHSIISSISSSPMTQFEDYCDDGPLIDQETFDQNLLNFGETNAQKDKHKSSDEKNDDIMAIDDQDGDSGLSEISDNAYELLSRMSVREEELKEEEFLDAINITQPMTLLSVDEPMPSTSVNTFIPENLGELELLRMMEMYIQSVSEPPPATTLIGANERSSRRSKRYMESSSTINYYAKSATDSHASTSHFQEPNTPYVPSRVWYNSTWEDWAQLDIADILHYPFTSQEIATIQHCIHKTKGSRVTKDLESYWQYVSTQLPGRTPLDCKCFWSDLKDGQYKLFDKVIMVRKYKAPKNGRSRYQLLSKRARTGILNGNALRSIHWANMSRESIIQDGSGDAITLAIFNDPAKGVRIAVGSLCDENIQYNVPGNLRLWDSETNECRSLSGHQTEHETTGQEIWRTVTDVKMSKDQSLIYSSSHDGRANIWRAKTGKHVSTLSYHSKPINQLAVNYSTNENVLATCSNDGTATVWSLSRNGKTGSGVICGLDSSFYSDPHVDCIEFGHDATNGVLFLGVNNKDVDHPGYVETYDISSGKPHTRYDSMNGCVSTLAVSSSGRYIVSGNYNRFDNMSGDRFIHLHDSRRPKVVSKFYSGHPDVNVVAISPCERYVASGNAEKEKGEVVIFDVRNAKRSLHILSHDQTLVNQSLIAPDSSIGIGGLHWMSDSRIIVTGGGDSTIKIWNIEGTTELLKSYQTANCVTSLTVNEETMTIAAGVAGAQGIVHVWQP
ncbi:hypothetical protein [Parasitella parasitica]|uniref:Myb-like domain-containing protein n=1 Tax=Parasitella parasitica TaxID=35722 RepID=A0A0B7NAZ0_9FUNG|nr:hypothetical protein [Parasitella parasitica]